MLAQSYQLLSLAATFLGLFPSSYAQYPPPVEYTNVIQSPLNPNVRISYKTPSAGTCATIFSTQRQFTGYITLPPETLAPISQNYSINTFFWFVEARQKPETAPLTIWLNGGPGSSSLIGFFAENGPCEVVQMKDGSYGTQTRLWGWDRSSNVLYIDQPVQVGLSYDTATNASLDLMQGKFVNPPTDNQGSAPAYTFLNGTFSSQQSYATANTSQIAARAVWHFLQTFLYAFPEYNPGVQPNDTTTYPTGVNLFTESYGGEYGPVLADYFEYQNDLLHVGQLPPEFTLEIELASIGILNGLVDFRIQAPFFPIFANNNTYGIKAIDTSDANDALTSMRASGGCLDQLDQCRNLQNTQDYAGEGDVALVNSKCSSAYKTCAQYQDLLSSSGRSVYDIRQKDPSPFPSSAFLEYLNTAQVQRAIGTPINYTSVNPVLGEFASTGDPLRGTQLSALGRLLARGVRVALLYGDADFICNWLGGEALSLALATMLPAYAIPFPSAGYASIVVNDSYIGGAVRQFGNLSFVRIYDSGHLIPAYQPETAFTVFTRIIQGTALSTGEEVDLSTYGTIGPQYSTKTNKQGSSKDPVCWIRAIPDTCTPDQRTQILAGKGVVMNGVWFADANDYKAPSSSVAAGSPGKPSPNATMVGYASGRASVPPTGVYTATGTPMPSSAAAPGLIPGIGGVMVVLRVLLALYVLLF
jgi:carboxypeptidase C (cathepsin A)